MARKRSRIGKVKNVPVVAELHRRRSSLREERPKAKKAQKKDQKIKPAHITSLPPPPVEWLSKDVYLKVSIMAPFLKMTSGQQVNKYLAQINWQYRSGNVWIPTALGKPYCRDETSEVNGFPIAFLVWSFISIRETFPGGSIQIISF